MMMMRRAARFVLLLLLSLFAPATLGATGPPETVKTTFKAPMAILDAPTIRSTNPNDKIIADSKPTQVLSTPFFSSSCFRDGPLGSWSRGAAVAHSPAHERWHAHAG